MEFVFKKIGTNFGYFHFLFLSLFENFNIITWDQLSNIEDKLLLHVLFSKFLENR